MYCAEDTTTKLEICTRLTDEDLERFDWYILTERVGRILFRVVTAERPT